MGNDLNQAGVLAAFAAMLAQICEQARLDLRLDTVLIDIPGIDSLRLLQAIALLEERCMVEIMIPTLESLHQVGDVVDAILQARRCA